MKQIKFIKENFGVKIYTADLNGEVVFVKEAITAEGCVMIQREYTNQKFLFDLSQKTDLGFVFLKPSLKDGKLFFPYLGDEYQWLGSIENDFFIEPIKEYLDKMIIFMQKCHDIDISTLPKEMQIDAEMRRKVAYSKLETDADYLISKNILTDIQKTQLSKIFLEAVEKTSFQHHDVVPWHMAKHKKSGEIVLIDSGWSGISLYFYDISYFILQIIAYGNDPNSAVKFYATIKELYKFDKSFDGLLGGALAYRGVRLAAEIHKQGKDKQLEKILPIFLTRRVV